MSDTDFDLPAYLAALAPVSETPDPDTGETVLTYPPIYKYDSKGKLRVWYMERSGASQRVVAGLDGGALVASGWKACKGKQKRTDIEQAEFMIRSGYEYGLKREYFLTPAEAEGGARFFKPMLAEKWKDLGWDGAMKRLAQAGFAPTEASPTGVFDEPKLDGFCCITQASGQTSRDGMPIISVPHVTAALALFFDQHPEAVLHGELYSHELRDDFETISSILKKQKDISDEQFETARQIQYHIYDYAAPHARGLVYSQRKAALVRDLSPFINDPDGSIRIVLGTPILNDAHGEELRIAHIDNGFEGQMRKLDIEEYIQNRSWQNLKNKVFDDNEFDVVSIEEGAGNYAGYAKRVTCWRPDADRSPGPNKDNTFGAGIKGKRDAKLAALLHDKTQKVVTIRHFGWTKDGVPRQGVAIKWHGEARVL